MTMTNRMTKMTNRMIPQYCQKDERLAIFSSVSIIPPRSLDTSDDHENV